ncbi:MAG TPA: BON domain-containing protein [Myxococcales bacterium]|nr:BON domain-containing protein [Myxococcales bacterium]
MHIFSRGSVLLSLFLASVVGFGASGLVPAPAQAFTPYRLLVQAVKSPLRPLVFVQDKRLKANLRAALLVAEPGTALSVKAYVGGGHGYLVGWVKDAAQRKSLEAAARTVTGLLSIAVYLPEKPTGADAPSTTDEIALKAQVLAAILVASGAEKTNIAVVVLGTHVILVGVVHTTEDIQTAAGAAGETEGVSGVTNFLSVPLAADARPSRGILH